MMKKERSKEMTGAEPEAKNKAVEKKIRCTRECVMPGLGHFKSGELIVDEGKIARIADNPNFEIVSEEEQP